MLLLHQVGSVKIGEVVRYTVTYTPSRDRILPSPELLHLRIRNTSAIALRAAFVHGPYTLSVAAYPAAFNPHEKFHQARTHGVPEFEPMLKAGGSWSCHLIVPDNVRQTAGTGTGHFGGHDIHADPDLNPPCASWIIEVSSQVIFSTSAAVGFEILLGRDEKSVNTGTGISLPLASNNSQSPQPGKIADHQQSMGARDGHHPVQPKGIFSNAISMRVDDTASLWNTPRLPGWDDMGKERLRAEGKNITPAESVVTTQHIPNAEVVSSPPAMKDPKKIHLVVLTHGLHSNLGADMLFLKESIDVAVQKAKKDAKARKERERAAIKKKIELGHEGKDTSHIEIPPAQEGDDDDEEEVIVRGFSGNATRTERGIKYLGKRLAKFILAMTYPDQPFLPVTKAASDSVVQAMKGDKSKGSPVHKRSTIHDDHSASTRPGQARPYKFTSISFIAHSLGGLVQTYAIAYIQNHSPQFFNIIRPVNFITLATPFLGLSNENPLYVKFALDFGLVGRSGQDLGLTWRAPTLARSGWGAIVSNLGETAHKKVLGESQPESKPLLRILPTGPAHTALQKFRNRTVYSNVVNDGIVPLRTSCLLFLDWQGLGRVEKARREAGLVGTVVGFGWAELTGTNVTSPRNGRWQPPEETESDTLDNNVGAATTPNGHHDSHDVPLPPTNATLDDDRVSLRSLTPGVTPSQTSSEGGPFSGFFSLFQRENTGSASNASNPKSPSSSKANKIYHRSQILKLDKEAVQSDVSGAASSANSSQSRVTAGHDGPEDGSDLSAPPKTTFFESAGDLLNPKIPSVEFLIDPAQRQRTIFHDRVYHPADIPPPPLKKRPTSLTLRRRSLTGSLSSSNTSKMGGGNGANASVKPSGSEDSTPYMTPKNEDSWNDHSDFATLPSPSLTKQGSSIQTNHKQPQNDKLFGADVTSEAQQSLLSAEVIDSSNMKVEEKIARAYHRDLSWRKVLVKVEPDAHNNIIVRRMFANAFGWPVVKHLVDAHFSDEAAARMRDEDEVGIERAESLAHGPTEDGRETRPLDHDKTDSKFSGALDSNPIGDIALVKSENARGRQNSPSESLDSPPRTDSERREAQDSVSALRKSAPGPLDLRTPTLHSEGGLGLGFAQAFAHGHRSPNLRISPGGYIPPSSTISPVTTTLPASGNASGSGIVPETSDEYRPVLRERVDSVTWSERDWVDSGEESDDEALLFGYESTGDKTPTQEKRPVKANKGSKNNGKNENNNESDASVILSNDSQRPGDGNIDAILEPSTPNEQGVNRSASPLSAFGSLTGGWNWTEKIVGKSKSPGTTTNSSQKPGPKQQAPTQT